MKNIYLIILLVVWASVSGAQDTFRIKSGTNIRTAHNSFIVFKNMNLVNNGSYVQSVGDGVTRLTGNINTTTTGSGTTTLDQLEVFMNNGNTHTLSSLVSIRNVVTLSSGQLVTNGYLTLKSDAVNTARVAKVTSPVSPAVVGEVMIERYNSARKAWRLLSIPSNTLQTIKQSWQEGATNGTANPLPGFGIQITGPAGTSAGFDLSSPSPSMKTYDPISNSWVGVPNTNTYLIKSTGAYMTFIRGDRLANSVSSLPTETILRTKGDLYTGDQPTLSVLSNKYATIGNPYASPVDFTTITKTGGVDDKFYAWDPFIAGNYGYGGYQIMSSTNDWKPVPGGSVTYPSGIAHTTIQLGEGFLVHATSVPGTLSFSENSKITDGNLKSFAKPVEISQIKSIRQFFRVFLFSGINPSDPIIDGNVVAFDPVFSNGIDGNDALKIIAGSENFCSIRNTKILAIEARAPVVNTDTVYYYMSNMAKKVYQLGFAPENMQTDGLEAFLIDRYLNTTTTISLTDSSFINISITSDPASSASDRFKVIFKPMAALPVSFTSVKAYAKGSAINVEWKVEGEYNIKNYEVEKSIDLTNFAFLDSVQAKNIPSSNYWVADLNPGDGFNYYRIRSNDINGIAKYSEVVKVVKGDSKNEISVFPNPIINNHINLQLNKQPSGNYGIRLINKSGEVIMSTKIEHLLNTPIEIINIQKKVSHGIYQLEIIKPDNTQLNINILF
ncbi:MAG: hypothetical protein Q8891_16460 [Bacteroidota bacterium]|nr:hypothetical protein [Bacteroidota bacterium]